MDQLHTLRDIAERLAANHADAWEVRNTGGPQEQDADGFTAQVLETALREEGLNASLAPELRVCLRRALRDLEGK